MSDTAANKTFALFARPNNRKIIRELENAGAEIVEFPTFEAASLNETPDEIFSHLKSFDWIIFPDVLTVEFFLQRLEANEIDFFELDEIRVCAAGEAVSDQLRFVQLHADVIPPQNNSAAMIEAMKNYIHETDFADLKILLPTEADGETDLKNALTETGAGVFELPVHRIKSAPTLEISKAKALLKGGAIDEFVFTDQTDFVWLRHLFPNEPLEKLLAEISVSAADGLIFQTMREFDLKRAVLFQPGKIDTLKR